MHNHRLGVYFLMLYYYLHIYPSILRMMPSTIREKLLLLIDIRGPAHAHQAKKYKYLQNEKIDIFM